MTTNTLPASATRYESFLDSKAQFSGADGFNPIWIPDFLYDVQQFVADWNIRMGRSADFLDCGFGKTLIELVWAENVVRFTNRAVLILTPLAVAKQMATEGERFGLEVLRSSGGHPITPGVYVTNYEKLHLFDPVDFAGCVCDESSAIKAMNGVRRAQVTEFLRTMRYRLLATATAAPNDYIELGTTSEALGVMGQVDMLNRFFKNDNNTSDTKMIRRRAPSHGGPISAGWRFKGHAEVPFWRFVCVFARAGRKPSDLGDFSDKLFQLPPLIEREHIVEARTLAPGMLFPFPASNRREELDESRRTIKERCEKAAALVRDTAEPFLIWCNLNPEGDLLAELIPDALQIAGSDSDEAKEEKWDAFLSGQARGVVTKHKIGGWGLNLQHCRHVVEFVSHSWEAHYQGVRRCWRLGQTKPVINDLIATEGQKGIKNNLQRKARNADRMFDALVKYMQEAVRIEGGYKTTEEAQLPAWLASSTKP